MSCYRREWLVVTTSCLRGGVGAAGYATLHRRDGAVGPPVRRKPTLAALAACAACRDARDAYLPAFRACVTQAAPQSVMCSYNRVNGTPACASSWLLGEQLRRRWGFRGCHRLMAPALHAL